MDARDPVSDDALDRELQQVLRAEPAADLAARIRQRLAAETMAPRWWTLKRTCVAGVAITAATAVGLMLVSAEPRVSTTAPGLVAVPLTMFVAAAPAIAEEASAPSGHGRPQKTYVVSDFSRNASGHRFAPESRRQTAEVIVSPADQRAFWAYVAAERANLLPPDTAPPTPKVDKDGAIVLPPVEIAPIEIEPLSQIAEREGEER